MADAAIGFCGIYLNRCLLPTVLCLLVKWATAMDSFEMLFSNSYEQFNQVPVTFARRLPLELRGSMIHNGLGLFDFGERSFVHPFDGLAKLTKIQFFPGTCQANFSMRFLRTSVYTQSLERGDIAPYLFFDGVEPPFNLLQRALSLLHGLDNTNVNVLRLPSGRNSSRSAFLALNDITRSYRFDPHSLDTLGRIEAAPFESPEWCGGEGTGGVLGFLSRLSSAHPLPELGTGSYLTFVTAIDPERLLAPDWRCTVSLVRMTSDTGRQVVRTWRLKRASYMHSFAATGRFALLFLNPLFIDLPAMVATADPVRSLSWEPDQPMRVLWHNLVTGAAGEAAITDGHFLMHHINAYEEADDNSVIVDATAYPDLGFLQGLTRASLRDPELRDKIPVNSRLRRYRVHLDTGRVDQLPVPYATEQDPIRSLEMPVINEAFRYRRYCYVYGVLLKSDSRDLSKVSLVRKSMCDGAKDLRWYRERHYPSEPAFYPAGDPSVEDSGYLVSLIMDGQRNVTYIGVFNATTMTLVNQAYLPSWLPYRLHGKTFL